MVYSYENHSIKLIDMQATEQFSGLFDFGDDIDLSEMEDDLNEPIQRGRPYPSYPVQVQDESAISVVEDDSECIDVQVISSYAIN